MLFKRYFNEELEHFPLVNMLLFKYFYATIILLSVNNIQF